MFILRLNQCNSKLSYYDRLIGDFLLDYYEGGKNTHILTSVEIAKEIGCGQATVIRFSKKLGYPGFKSMMIDVLKDAEFYGSSNIEIGEIHDTIGKLKNLYGTSLSDVINKNNGENIGAAIKYLKDAHVVLCFGIRGSYISACIMYYRLMEMGRGVLRSEHKLEGVSIARNLSKRDVALMVSVSGETEETLTVARVAKERGVKIISITGAKDNTLEKLSDIALKSTEYSMHTNRFDLINRVPEMFIMDLLFIHLWGLNEDLNMKSVLKFIEDYRGEEQDIEKYYRL